MTRRLKRMMEVRRNLTKRTSGRLYSRQVDIPTRNCLREKRPSGDCLPWRMAKLGGIGRFGRLVAPAGAALVVEMIAVSCFARDDDFSPRLGGAMDVALCQPYPGIHVVRGLPSHSAERKADARSCRTYYHSTFLQEPRAKLFRVRG